MKPRFLSDLNPVDSEAAPRVHRLSRFGLTTQHVERLVRFFARAFDCHEAAREGCSGAGFERLMGVRGGATSVALRLGVSSIEILQFDHPGNPYVPNLSPFDNEFQHFALVVADMDAAFSRLSSVPGWSAISSGGPQQLPPSSGGVKAFKFRDPDGHPLELLAFPQAQVPEYWRNQPHGTLFLGVDHSAVSCSSAAQSVDFYRKIGLQVTAQSFNHGIEQQCLDGIPTPQLDVIALAPAAPTPHVELLCYRNRNGGRQSSIRSNDIGATRLIFQRGAAPSADPADALIFDPDGHHVLIRATVPDL
jgi:catechol 2,3-dioxygenase-like lactoylglutathione lyase family enzyme